MPYSVWRGWIEFARLEPFGDGRADLRYAQLASLMANAWLRKKGQRPYSIRDFMFDFDGEIARSRREGKTADELASMVTMMNRHYGGKFIDKREETG